MIYARPSQLETIGAITVVRGDRAPARSREAVKSWLEAAHPAREITVLAASELVTNAVRYSNPRRASASTQGTPDVITLRLAQGADYLRLAVTDPGSTCSEPMMVPLQVPSVNAERGRGLTIVDALSRGRWGSYQLPQDGLRLVWCHLDLTPTPAELNALFAPPSKRPPTPSAPNHAEDYLARRSASRNQPLSPDRSSPSSWEIVMPEPIPADVAEQAATYLAELQILLEERGLHARVLAHAGLMPRLRVINPDCASLCEVVTAAPLDGEWSLWWSWAEQITGVGDMAAAVARIGHVLTPAAPAAHQPT